MANAPATDNAARVIALIDGALEDWEVGVDAMRWRPDTPAAAAAPVPATDLRVGDVVDYHGSITHAHDEYVVTAVQDGGRLTLRNHLYPETRLTHVRPTSVTQTGRWVPVCRCGHPHTHPVAAPNGRCPRPGCDCPHHPNAEMARRTATVSTDDEIMAALAVGIEAGEWEVFAAEEDHPRAE